MFKMVLPFNYGTFSNIITQRKHPNGSLLIWDDDFDFTFNEIMGYNVEKYTGVVSSDYCKENSKRKL